MRAHPPQVLGIFTVHSARPCAAAQRQINTKENGNYYQNEVKLSLCYIVGIRSYIARYFGFVGVLFL